MKMKDKMRIKSIIHALLLVVLASSVVPAWGKGTKKEPKRSVVTVERLSPEAQRKYDYYFLEGLRLREKGDFDSAFEMYEHCLSIDPGAASALYELSQFYMFLKQPERALAALQKAVGDDPGNFWYKQTLAAYHQSRGDFKKAIAVYEDMVKLFPARQEPLMVLVDLYNQTKDYPNVIRTLDKLEEKSGKSEQISMEKFRIYLNMNKDKQAFREIENLAKEYPHDMRYLTVLGNVYLNNGKTEEAYNTYKKVLEQEPDNVMAKLSLVSYYDKIGRKDLYQQEIDSLLLNRKVDSNVKLSIMQQMIGQSEQTDRDSTKIIRLFESILAQPQEDAQIPMLYVQYLMLKKMEKETIPVLNKIIDIDPENVPARLMLLSDAIRNNNLTEAIRICEAALQYSPETLEFYFYLGMAYNQENRPDDALATLKKGVGQVTSDSNKDLVSDLYSALGDMYHLKKMSAEAYAAYDSSLVYNPDNSGTLNNYAYYLSVERKELDKAEEMSFRTVKAEPANGTYLDTYAWILFEKGKYAEAKLYIDSAMENGGAESDVVVEHCGDIYYMNGDQDGAMEYWQKALDLGSKSETLKKKISQKKYIAE